MMSQLTKILPRSFTRNVSTKLPLVISEEVQQALAENKPVVSLESTILTHGFPYPENLSLGVEFEDAVRKEGGVPATIAFLKGVPHVGLNRSQLTELTENYKVATKVSRRDIGHVMAKKLYGATTIASTSILSCMAGIKVFGTGGLGGVHREGQFTLDISNDLVELGRNPITVVCAGPKSILDIGLTMEYLETQGVYVTTYNEFNEDSSSIEVPGFYARKSGVKSPNSFTSFREISDIIRQQSLMGLSSGNLVCIPPPKEYALDSDFIEKVIKDANEEAKQKGIRGKDVTPFLLLKVGEMTKGKSLDSNKNFVFNNIKAATKIAKSLVDDEKSSLVQPTFVATPESGKSQYTPNADTLVVGSVAVDSISKLDPGHKTGDSNPGSTTTSIGGVGHNVALASQYSGGSTRLVSIVGDDQKGQMVLSTINMDTSGLCQREGSQTASYTSIHSSDGELIVACGDMKIIENDFSDHIIEQIKVAQPNTIVIDCNLTPDTINKVLQYINGSKLDTKVIIEPTSLIKSRRIAQLDYPVDLITPTVNELNAIYETLASNGKFDDDWFEHIDRLKLDQIQRFNLKPMYQQLYNDGVIQKAFRILPFAHNILIKLGKNGLLSIGANAGDVFTAAKKKSPYYLKADHFHLDYYPIPKENENLKIVNVTGAGDSLLGYLVANLHKRPKDILLYNAQLASGRSISHSEAISPEISKL